MRRSCGITDEQLLAFARGENADLEDHVFSCHECQADLAAFWEDELEVDVAAPVVAAVRLDWLITGVLSTGVGVASRIASAAMHYMTGRTES